MIFPENRFPLFRIMRWPSGRKACGSAAIHDSWRPESLPVLMKGTISHGQDEQASAEEAGRQVNEW
jgi:hypothetical protein